VNPTPYTVPDGIAPIEAFRVWTFEFEGAVGRLHPLRGWSADPGATPWGGAESGWVRATCRGARFFSLPPHAAPGEECSCGFYAVKQIALLPSVAGFGDTVLGRVQLAGTIVEHELGFRAELARIVELVPWLGSESEARRLAMCLGVAVGRAIPRPPYPDPEPSTPRRPLASWVSVRSHSCKARVATAA
jgi:hypothetical protein